MTLTPRVWIGCLAAYNSGTLHGKWVDVDDEESLQESIKEVLKTSPEPNAEEWGFFDSENLGDINEYMPVDDLCQRADFVREHGELGLAVLEHFSGEDLDYCETLISDHYHGEWDSEEDYARNLIEDCYSEQFSKGTLLTQYFDYEAFTRDIFINDYFSLEVDGSTHVFSNY